MRKAALLVTSFLAMLGLSVIAPATTSSAVEAQTAVASSSNACGSSYTTSRGPYNIQNDVTDAVVGQMFVYWSPTLKRNCLITYHYGSNYGSSTITKAMIRPEGYSWPSCPNSVGCSEGNYSYYAGPVYTPSGLDMTGRCVYINGTVTYGSSGKTYGPIAC